MPVVGMGAREGPPTSSSEARFNEAPLVASDRRKMQAERPNKDVGAPEDPEKTPNIPDTDNDNPSNPLCKHDGGARDLGNARSDSKGGRKSWWLFAIILFFILAAALGIVWFTSPEQGGEVASYLSSGGGTSLGGHLPGSTRQDQRGLVEPPGAFHDSPRPLLQSEAAAAHAAGQVPAFQRDGQFCNTSAPIPEARMRYWDLSDGWRRVCEEKNVKDKYPLERNWCWVGMNQMCHWNLKSHFSWATFQNMSAGQGMCPTREDEPFDPIEDPELCDRPERGAFRTWTAAEQREARAWFRDNVAVYVLSLPGLGDNRWAMISKRLTELHIWATRVPGVDMRVTGALDAAKRQGFVPKEFNFTQAQQNAYEKKHDMGSILGTVGCASAHFKAQTKAIADGSPLAIIMEDDSHPIDDFVPRVWSLVREELPCDWEVTALLSRCGYGRCVSQHLMRVMPDANEPAWRCHQGSNWGMHAVLYNIARLPKLQKLWQRTVFNEDRPHCMDIDVALASISDLASFYAVPAVQDPSFVEERNHRSARWDINQAASSTTSRTTTTTEYFVPTLKPGEPWPGAWNFG